MTIYEIIQEISSIGSTKTKQAIMESHKDNETLKLAFLYAESPRKNYFIKASTIDDVGKNDLLPDTIKALDKLVNREITGDRARNYVNGILTTLTKEAGEILVRIINKDLRCNAGTAIANKVWPKLIEEYPVLLCSKFDSKSEKYLRSYEGKCTILVQKKSDGGRVIVTVDQDGVVSYRSRNGSALNLFNLFDSQFSKFPNTVFDGELLVLTSDGKPNRKLSNGLYTKFVRGTISLEEAEQFVIDLWDMIPAHEYVAGLGTETYKQRYTNLLSCGFTGKLNSILTEEVTTIDQCLAFYERMRADGQEGAIIKIGSSVYEDRRSKNYVKLKAEETCDLLCVGVEEGSGKYAGMIGALVMQTSCGKLKTNVGTGLTDEDRQKDPSEYLNHVCELKYNEVITSKSKDTSSLFLPVFVQVRHDKTVANSLDELK